MEVERHSEWRLEDARRHICTSADDVSTQMAANVNMQKATDIATTIFHVLIKCSVVNENSWQQLTEWQSSQLSAFRPIRDVCDKIKHFIGRFMT